jgi:polyhydroxyalkanoate synthesis regulator phasin
MEAEMADPDLSYYGIAPPPELPDASDRIAELEEQVRDLEEQLAEARRPGFWPKTD